MVLLLLKVTTEMKIERAAQRLVCALVCAINTLGELTDRVCQRRPPHPQVKTTVKKKQAPENSGPFL